MDDYIPFLDGDASLVFRYRANCCLNFYEIDRGLIFDDDTFVDKLVEKSLVFLDDNFIREDCFGQIYTDFSLEDKFAYGYDESYDNMMKFYINFPLILDDELDMDFEDLESYLQYGDGWLAENKMDKAQDFISQALEYKCLADEYMEEYFSYLHAYKVIYDFDVLNFEFFSFLDLDEGLDQDIFDLDE